MDPQPFFNFEDFDIFEELRQVVLVEWPSILYVKHSSQVDSGHALLAGKLQKRCCVFHHAWYQEARVAGNW